MTQHWKIPKLAWIAISLAVTAEAVSNALRAYDLGAHLERFTTTILDVEISIAGLVLVFAAIAVSLSQTRAAWVALTPGDAKQRLISGIAAALLLAISISAMASHILSAQRAKSGAETQDSAGYTNAKADYDAKAAELETVKTARAVRVVDAAIEAFAAENIDVNIWRRTVKCTDISKKSSRDECSGILPLLAERAQAERKAELEAQIPALKRAMDSHKLTDAAGKGEVAVSWAWAWIMGVGVVMIATFGPVIFAKVETVPGIPAKSNPGIQNPGIGYPGNPPGGGGRGRKRDPRILDFSERFREKNGRHPSVPELRQTFPDLPRSTAYEYADFAKLRAKA